MSPIRQRNRNNYHKLTIHYSKRNNKHGGSGQRVWKAFHGSVLIGFSPKFSSMILIMKAYQLHWYQMKYHHTEFLHRWKPILEYV